MRKRAPITLPPPSKIAPLQKNNIKTDLALESTSRLHKIEGFSLNDFLARYLAGNNCLRSARSVSRKRLALAALELSNFDYEASKLYQQHQQYLQAKTILKGTRNLTLKHLLAINKILSPESHEAGKIRTGQNWLSSGKKINYVPPSPSQLNQLMENLIEFINEKSIPPLSKAYIAHIQLALIHPFNDGNGRASRVLWEAIIEKNGLDLINPVLFRLTDSEYGYSNALKKFTINSNQGAKHYFWSQSIRWGETYKENVSPFIYQVACEIRSKTVLSNLSDKAQIIVSVLWTYPILHAKVLQRYFDWTENESLCVIAELVQLGLLTPRRVKHPFGEIVYENKPILDLWQKLEEAIFN